MSATDDSKASDERTPPDDYDSSWKALLESLTEGFVALLFPALHGQIHWRHRPVFLNNELAKLTPEAETGKGVVDHLMRVQTREGRPAEVLIHVEIQAQRRSDFTERMFRYHYRVFDKHEQHPVSLAVLADDQRTWRPSCYQRGWGGCRLRLDFLTAKLLDFATRRDELEASENPFALAVMAHLQTQRTRHRACRRAAFKRALTTLALDRGWDHDATIALLHFIDWLMTLPEDLQQQHEAATRRELERRKMPYLNVWQREGD